MRITNPLGGLLAMSAKGQLKCPEAIVRMRATVARMKPVRELRPQVSHLQRTLLHMLNLTFEGRDDVLSNLC